KHRVAGGHVGDRDTAGGLLGHGDGGVGEGGPTDTAQVDAHRFVGHRAEGLAQPVGGGRLGAVALAVVETEGVAGAALVAGNGQHGGGVEAAGYQHHGLVGFVGHGGSQWPGWSFHSSLWSCSWRRTGRRSAMIQSASSVGERLPWLGENSTEPTRSTRRYSSRRMRAQS